MSAATVSPLLALHLDVTYSVTEDRVHLHARNEEAGSAFWLTRRLCRALLKAVIEVMTRTSKTASLTSASTQDVLLFEHVEAINRRPVCRSTEKTAKPAPLSAIPAGHLPQLLDQINLSMEEGRLKLSLMVKGQISASMSLERDNMHQLLSILHDKTSAAGWDFEEFTWLHRRGHFVFVDQPIAN